MSRYTPLKFWCRTLPPPPVPGGVAPKFGSEKVSRYTGVSQLQLRVSRYTMQLRLEQNKNLDCQEKENRNISGAATHVQIMSMLLSFLIFLLLNLFLLC